jgi:hypothetical protein
MTNETQTTRRRRSSSPVTLDTPRAKNLALILLAMTQFVIVIDASIVNVALRRSASICTSHATTSRGS